MRSLRWLTPVLTTGLLAVGCGDAPVGGIDAAVPGVDASHDAGLRIDAGSPLDASEPDDAGAQLDAGTPEPCDAPGAIETVACGSCGTTQRFCTAEGLWAYGLCSGEGECAPGSTRAGACGNCGTQAELCSLECAWEAQAGCTGEGECAPGARSRSGAGCASGETREVTCSSACGFEPSGACEADGCTAPGTTERVACGNCGTSERFCTAARVWSYGPCEGEGMCAPGSTDRVACGSCGTRMTRCTTACIWDASAACEGEGVCAPGSTTRTTAGCAAGESRELTCNAACTYDPGPCAIDECTPGATTTEACGMCGTRVRTCDATRRWVDGACMGEGVCTPGTTGTQACGMCGTQPTRCNASCSVEPSGSCAGEGTCAAGTTSSCRTGCGTSGTQTCSATCTPGTCNPPPEICNGIDDDCNGTIDEGCASCTACLGSTAVTGTGGRYMVTLGPNVRTGSCGGSGGEALLSLTLTAPSDVFITTHGASVNTVVYARSCTCDGAEIACNDNADGRLTSALRLTALAPGNYAIVIDSIGGAALTSVPVDVYVTPAAAQGDRCGNPRVLAAGTTRLTGNTCAFANDYDIALDSAGCNLAAGGDGADAVYYFHVPTTRSVTFSACGAANDFDGTLYIRSVCNGTTLAQQIACDDDGCTGTSCEGYRPTFTTTLAPGLYYLMVDGYVFTGTPPPCTSCGNFDIAITGL